MSSHHKAHHSSTPTPLPNGVRGVLHVPRQHSHPRRSATPNGRPSMHAHRVMTSVEGDMGAEEDPRISIFKELYIKSEARLVSLFDEKAEEPVKQAQTAPDGQLYKKGSSSSQQTSSQQTAPAAKKAARAIDEDDYDDSDGEDGEDSVIDSPLKSKSALPPIALTSTPMFRALSATSTPASIKGAPSDGGKTTEDARKKLEEDKKATEDAAKRNFHLFFYTLENDRDAMLEQKRLEESDRQVEAELGSGNNSTSGHASNTGQPGSLSQTNLGASSLTLKNLIRRIDDRRDKVKASDTELRSLISEVRKNRSKWANEEKVGQEELYEASEKVLNELKAMMEHSNAFLTKVNKRDAPDYGNIVKHPMDLGTMTKKLKNLQYKSKKEFVDDLNLIWDNCLLYNRQPEHFLRRHATFMQKETQKLVPLIPNIVIRDRAEVEAEERRLHANLEGDEESDDEPIMSSRGRKAPSKKSKKGTVARKAPAGEGDGSPDADGQHQSAPNGISSHLKSEPHRAESDTAMDDTQKDLSTPPPGSVTPVGVNGILAHGAAGTQSDAMDIDGESVVSGILPSTEASHIEADYDDLEYKTWKQVTKRDRALVTAERHRLFDGEKLDPEAPALLRTKLGMRRWLRKQKAVTSEPGSAQNKLEADTADKQEDQLGGETLAEGINGEEEKVLPDYYDPLAALPDLSERLRWVDDSEGRIQDVSEEFLRALPSGSFVAPSSRLVEKIDENLRQIQKTQKLTSKIAVVKQMQLQSQMYQGQFQKHETIPLVEQDAEPHAMLDEGPVIAPAVTRAALQRSAAKLLVHAGFDDCQPSALETITDMASDYFQKIAADLMRYVQAPRISTGVNEETGVRMWKRPFNLEESILHTLQENGTDLESLDSYVTEDVERMGTRLTKTHDSMKTHLADLLRPALTDAGPDGVNAFNDGSEQFVGGDFAEELGEDFFGFKELGLDAEFGDVSMSVPLHLLKSRMYDANQAQNPSSLTSNSQSSLPEAETYAPITVENVKSQVGLVQEFFLAKLRANNDQPLVEDEDLPQKQRLPKPRLPPTGKITSPRKRPFKEPGPGKGHPKKKMKLNDGEGKDVSVDAAKTGSLKPPGDVSLKANADKADQGSHPSGDPEKQAGPTKALTNGVGSAGPHGAGSETGVAEAAGAEKASTEASKSKSSAAATAVKSKEKMVNGESGGMISPESLEAS